MKTCNVDGCTRPIWSKGMCKIHIPKSPIKSKVPKEPVVKSVLNLDKRNQLFLSVWQTRKHRCEICDKPLGKEPQSYMFDHLLEKSKYKFLEFEPDNIALVCLECHDKKTRGFVNAIYQEKINFVITKFNVS